MAQFHVLHLVRSLNDAEVRQFRQFVKHNASGKEESRNSPPYYFELFEALRGYQGFDEQEFISELKQVDNYPSTSTYHFQKSTLKDHLLNAIRGMRKRNHQEKEPSFRAREFLEDASFLRKKTLYALSRKRLRKARALADAAELHEIQLEILRMERAYLLRSKSVKDRQLLEQTLAEMRHLTKVIAIKYEILELRDLLFSDYRRSKLPDVTHSPGDFFKDYPLLVSPPVPSCFDAMINYHLCRGLLFQQAQTYRLALEEHKQIVQLWLEHPKIQEERRVGYRNALNNYLALSNAYFEAIEVTAPDPEAEKVIEILKASPTSPWEEAEVFQSILNNQIQYCLRTQKFADAEEVITKFEKGIEVVARKEITARILAFYHVFTLVFLLQGKYHAARKWNKRFLNEDATDLRIDLVIAGKIIQLILALEFSNPSLPHPKTPKGKGYFPEFDMLDEIRNFKRFIRSQKAPQFLGTFLEFLKMAAKRTDFKSLTSDFKELLTQLTMLKDEVAAPFETGTEIIFRWLNQRS